MTWHKLDNDLALPDFPYSAFLADGLTANVNSYSTLNSGSTVSWLATASPMWASYGQAMGTVVTFDVGVNCGRVQTTVFYRTATNEVDDDGYCGRVYLRHLTSGREV